MQGLVDQIWTERQGHQAAIDGLTLAKIKQLVSTHSILTAQQRKSFVPRRKTLDELTLEAKRQVKDPWRGTSMKNDFISQAPILRPKLLNPWEMAAAL